VYGASSELRERVRQWSSSKTAVSADDVLADFQSSSGLMATMIANDDESWGYKIDGFVHGLSDSDWADWDISAEHHLLFTSFIRHDLYQPLFGGGMGMRGGILARLNPDASSQWKMMGMGRQATRDSFFPHAEGLDTVKFQNPGTCNGDQVPLNVNPETAPRPVGCCDRPYGQSFKQDDGSYNVSKQRETFLQDIEDLATRQIGDIDGATSNSEVHAAGLFVDALAGILYPVDGLNRPNGPWVDSYPQTLDGQWVNHACNHLRAVTGVPEWPVYEYAIDLDNGMPTWDLKQEHSGKSGAARLTVVGHIKC
jgi:hypothetical protein